MTKRKPPFEDGVDPMDENASDEVYLKDPGLLDPLTRKKKKERSWSEKKKAASC